MKTYLITLIIILTFNVGSRASFKDKVLPFMDRYCYSCHDSESSKGDLNLQSLEESPASDNNVAVWMEVMVHLRERTMPPPKKRKQPTEKERLEVKELIERELFKSARYNHRLQKPEYANYIEHKKLFDGSIKAKTYTASRLWRRNPFIFESTKAGLSKRKLDKVKQPFGLEEKQQIRDYASLIYADSATLDTMLRNAETIVDHQLEGAVFELYKKKNNGQLPPRYRPYEEEKKGKKKTIRPRHPERSPIEFTKILETEKSPSEKDLEEAIRKQFSLLINGEPEKRDFAKYSFLFKKNREFSDNYEALRGMLVAIAISPGAIYRSEIGSGLKDTYGRSLLSPVEMAFALSFAVGDSPDEGLLKAVKEGNLKSAEDVKREMQRILFDDRLMKPRLLRFFHEFFSYTYAPKVFKDDKRFVKRYTYDTLAQYMVSDADKLLRHTIDRDKDVLRTLLTTDRYFVGHSGDNEQMKNEVGAMYAVYDIIKDFKEKKFPYNLEDLEKGIKKKITAAGEKFGNRNYRHFNGNSAGKLKRVVGNARQKGISPIPDHRNINYIHAYNLTPDDWDFIVEQPAKMPNSPRAGILTHPSWLIAYSQNLDTDPVKRGKWIRERLLAGTIPDLPVTVDAKVPEDPHKTLRERFAVVEKAECWKCHRKMNPLGNVFEMYDDFGRYREHHFVEKSSGKIILETNRIASMLKSNRLDKRTVDISGSIDFSGEAGLDGKVKGAVEMMQKLGSSKLVRQSFVRHVFRFFMGRNETYRDSEVLIAADEAYVKSGGSFKALLVSLFSSDAFLYRKKINKEL